MPEDDLDPEPTTPAIDPNEHANLQLKVALLEAGVDLNTAQGKLVQQAFAGQAPDAEAIKGAWEAVKPQTAPVAETPPERIEGEDGQGEERRALGASSTIEPAPQDVDPMEASMLAAREVISPSRPGQRSGTRDDAVATGLHLRMEAAAAGDTRVLVQE